MEQQFADGISDSPQAPGKALNVTLWVLQIGAALMFFFVGTLKLAGSPELVALFDAIGIGQWFRYLTGGLEVLGAATLLVPRLSGAGALMLVGVMVGAIATHSIIGGSPVAALVLLVVTAIIAWGRRERTLALLGGSR